MTNNKRQQRSRVRYEAFSVESDSKTVKGTEYGYLTAILYLAPATEAGGRNLCCFASKECRDACLYGAGMAGVFPSIKRQRIAKTQQYFQDPKAFYGRIDRDMARLQREAKARGLTPCVRINGTSDEYKLAKRFAGKYSHIQFYDYTKMPKPYRRVSSNYHLTFSFSGENLPACLDALKHGVNVAVVFSGGLPETWHGHKVVNGDKSDLRFLDETGVVVGLTPKGNDARHMQVGGFIQIGGVK